MEKVVFTPDGAGEGTQSVEFFVLEQTRIGGVNYILVTDSEEGDSEALILKDIASEQDSDSTYVIVSEETELFAVAKVFEEMMEDIKFETT